MSRQRCRVLVPDGSMQTAVADLFREAGMPLSFPSRGYLGTISCPSLFPPPYHRAVQQMRPQDMPWVLAEGDAEVGLTGDDLLAEARAGDQVTIVRRLPLSRGGVGKTRIVLAVPKGSAIRTVDDLTPRHTVVTEFPNIAADFFAQHDVAPRVRVCHGSLEGWHHFGIADAMIENVETGTSLQVNGWEVLHEIMESMLCLVANPRALEKGRSAEVIPQMALLIDSVMTARCSVLIKANVPPGKQKQILAVLGSGHSPTWSSLRQRGWHALEVVVAKQKATEIILRLHAAGATKVIEESLVRNIP